MTGSMRADARRNRERILAAADQLFDQKGAAVSTEAIAAAAQLGVGTVFRHFPTKDALLDQLAARRLRRLIDDALEAADRNPANALFSFFAATVDQATRKRALTVALGTHGPGRPPPELRRELDLAVATLLAGAQQAGAVRGDVEVGDVLGLLAAACTAAETARSTRARDRLVSLILDGIRRPGGPAPAPPPHRPADREDPEPGR